MVRHVTHIRNDRRRDLSLLQVMSKRCVNKILHHTSYEIFIIFAVSIAMKLVVVNWVDEDGKRPKVLCVKPISLANAPCISANASLCYRERYYFFYILKRPNNKKTIPHSF